MDIRRHKSFYALISVFSLTVSPSLCHAEIYKCVENGKTTFSQYPCSTKSEKYIPTTTLARIPGLNGGTCIMTAVGSNEGKLRYTPTKHCLTSNSAKHVDEACSQWEALVLFADKFTGTARDNQNTAKRGTDCDHGAFAKCSYQKDSVEITEYAYPKKDTDINKMIEERSTYCKERNGIFNKL